MSDLQITDWSEVLISDIISEIQTGVSVNSENRRRGASELGILKTSCISRGQFFPEEHKAVLADEVERVKTPLKGESILMSRMNTPNLVGEIGYVQHQHPDIYLPDRLWMFSGKTGTSDTRFLSHLLSSDGFRQELGDIATGTSGSMKNIPQRSFLQIPIQLPPLPEQKKIAEILSGIDKLIERQERKISTLRHLQRSLIKDITLGEKEAGARQITDIGECPADWSATRLGDIADFANGNSFKSDNWEDDGCPIIRIQNLNGGSEFNYYAGKIDEKWFVPRGSLLFAWSGQRGKSFGPFIWKGADGVLNQHIFKVTHPENIYRPFLYLLLKMVQLNAERDAHGFKDSFMHVKKSDIVSTNIAVPAIEVQVRLATSYEQISRQRGLEEEKLKSIKNLKKSCSSDLLSGRKRVSI